VDIKNCVGGELENETGTDKGKEKMKKREIKKEWNSEREIKEETNRIKSWNERSK